jgi:hypothetical protein
MVHTQVILEDVCSFAQIIELLLNDIDVMFAFFKEKLGSK